MSKKERGGPAAGGQVQDDLTARAREVYLFTERLVSQAPDWITVFREVFGPDGFARRYFPTIEEMEQFERTPEYRAVQQFISQVREQGMEGGEGRVSTRVITVRIPKTLHESLRAEAHKRQTSMNKLCIWKLVQALDERIAESRPAPIELRLPNNDSDEP